MKSWVVAVVAVLVVAAAFAVYSRQGGFRFAEQAPGNPATPPSGSNPPVASKADTTTQWKASKHSRITPSAEPLEKRDICVQCHTGSGYAKQTTKAAEVSATPIGCNDCHDFGGNKERKLRIVGVVKLPNKKAISAGTAATCITCHNSRRNVSDPATLTGSSAPHYGPQGEMLVGTNAVEFPGTKYTNSVHSAIADACVTCHMAPAPGTPADAGGHSFRMSTKDGKDNISACRQCHPDIKAFDRTAYGDYDGNGTTEGIQTEVHGLIKLVEDELVKYAKAAKVGHSSGKIVFSDAAGKPMTVTDPKALQAAWNWLFVELDKSHGVHNPAYTVQVLQSTYKSITGQDVPGAEIK